MRGVWCVREREGGRGGGDACEGKESKNATNMRKTIKERAPSAISSASPAFSQSSSDSEPLISFSLGFLVFVFVRWCLFVLLRLLLSGALAPSFFNFSLSSSQIININK